MKTIQLNSTGPVVDLLQSTLKKLGFYSENIDGYFGLKTETAVKIFQRNFELYPDGIVGSITWDALSPYISGRTLYTVKPRDTLYSIAKKYNTTVQRILFANPEITPNQLFIGQIIVVPFGNIISTNIRYTSSTIERNLLDLQISYPFLEIGTIGTSILGKEIKYVKIGSGRKQVFYSASYHANEWITTPLLMKFIEQYLQAYVNNTTIFGYSARNLFRSVSLYIVPMVNPDGVDLVTGEIRIGSAAYNQAKSISRNYPLIPFPSGWKANIQGVDLNLQFPAGWQQARQIKFSQGFTSPAPRDFVGDGPLIAPESLAVYNFTLSHNFSLVIAYHTQGQEIYWQFRDYAPARAEIIGQQFASVSGYSLTQVAFNSSFAGYKDWFLQQYRRPGYTIEAGIGTNPLPISQFNEIYRDNIGILTLGMLLS